MSSSDDVVRPIVPVTIMNNLSGASMNIYAMIDSGADRDVISAGVIHQLLISTTTVQMTVFTVDNGIN